MLVKDSFVEVLVKDSFEDNLVKDSNVDDFFCYLDFLVQQIPIKNL